MYQKAKEINRSILRHIHYFKNAQGALQNQSLIQDDNTPFPKPGSSIAVAFDQFTSSIASGDYNNAISSLGTFLSSFTAIKNSLNVQDFTSAFQTAALSTEQMNRSFIPQANATDPDLQLYGVTYGVVNGLTFHLVEILLGIALLRLGAMELETL